MKKVFLLFLAVAVLTGCKEKKSEIQAIDPAFVSYISAFTNGVISATSSVRISLVSDVPEAIREEVLDQELLVIKPSVKGTYAWLDSRTLVFRPDGVLEPATRYQCKFHLHKLMEVPDGLKSLEFQFQTIQQALFVEIKGLTSLDDENLRWQQLRGSLKTADYANGEEVEKLLEGSQDGKELRVQWTHSNEGTLHEFTIDSISRTNEIEQVLVKWKGKGIGSEDEGEKLVAIPPLGDFKLMNTHVTQQPDQYVSLYFSDPISKSQDLRGLIYMESGEDLNLELDGSQVKVYPLTRIQGTRKLVISDALRNSLDFNLIESYIREITFTSINPDVILMGDGVILPGTDGLIFPFKAVNLRAVNVRIVKIYENNIVQFFQENQYDNHSEMRRVGRMILNKEIALSSEKPVDLGSWNTFSLDLARLIETEPGAIYNVSITFDRSQSLLPCAGGEKEDKLKPFKRDRAMERFNDPPEGYYYGDYEQYNWRERDNPCSNSYYIVKKNRNEASRNVLSSDLGIIAKGGRGTDLFVAVTSLVSTETLSGVEVEIYNYQNQLMAVRLSDSKGMASIPLLSKPFLLIAKYGTQRGYLRLDDGSALSTSMFDVGGSKNPQGLKGYLYGERGVWRPGDSIYMTFVLEDKNQILPGNHPVRFEMFTPESQLYLNQTQTSGLNGVYDFRTATEADAPTGDWLAKVSVGGTSFTKTVKIETVKPNRLKIEIDFGTELLKKGPIAGKLNAKWLHGALARNLKADIELDLRTATTAFTAYPDYVFDDPAKSFDAEEQLIFEGKLDSLGSVRFTPGIKVGNQAPGMLQAFFKTRVFENSGDFSVDRFPVLYSPFSTYVGVKIPEGPGWNGALYSNESNLIPIVTVDESGEPVDVSKLKIEIYDVKWRWWWNRDAYDDLASYVGRQSRHLIKTDHISTVNGKAMYEMSFDENLWGRKMIRITDPRGGHSTGQTFYLDYRGYWENNSQEGPGGAEMLSFSTDKKDYSVGEEIELNLPEIEEGRALVSLENGSRILQTFWVEAASEGPVKIKVSPEMAPNVFINVSLIQPHKNTVNDRPIRMYGIQSVNVVDPLTILHPQLEMPDVLEPEKEVSLSVSEKDGRAMTYTVAVVDEGLLDLTRFRTPDLWSQFYAREALGIHTWDLYKYVLGALKGEMAGLLSIGGDEFIKQDDKKNQNRFKPVVKYFGPFELKEGKSKSHTFTMPNYVGSVKTMVVASHKGAYGKTEKATPVKKPLMVLATLPRVISPTETVTLPVTVFSMDPKVKNVTVEVRTNDLFTVEGPSIRKITFEQEGDQVVDFTLKVDRRIGAGKVEVFASSGKNKASDLIDLLIRMPNPRITTSVNDMVEPGKNWKHTYEAVGLAGTNSGVLEVSVLPPLGLEKRLKYLMLYPHGCVEQTTSAVFPQLFLHRFVELDSQQKSEIQDHIMAGINKIRTFQVSNGGLTYWPGSSHRVSEWGSSYAGHFMLEAEALGYKLPLGFKNSWIKFQTRMANSWDEESEYFYYRRSNEINQAYRLYTLALAKKPALGAMNRMREMKELTVTAKWALAGAYMLVGKKEVAERLVAGLTTSVEAYRELSYTYGSSLRDQAMILEVLTLTGDQVNAKKLVDELAGAMASGDWYSTQTTAYVLLAIGKFVGETENSELLKFEYTLNGKKEKKNVSSPMESIRLPYEGEKGGSIELVNTDSRNIFVSVQLDGIPLDQKVADADSDLRMDVRYFSLDGNPIDPSKLVQGSDFMAEVSLTHPGVRANYKDLALTQMFPSGWEIRNLRLDNIESSRIKSKADYQDIRDDRVYSYFGLDKGETKTFVVLLNAAYLGEYILPAVYCEAMYDNGIHASRAGKIVKVIRQK
ncbi:MAG: MG2 domain-containing protein [Bacteroides sp.]|nr:MG2 domain-containing protein [Bacteroides sp.]